MAAGDEGSLEDHLNKATNPARRDEDWDAIAVFCEQVNKELEGPQIAVRLLAHKIQSPQEREALFALTTTEACVKNCGARFHQEVGKFRFLNEMIKVISPKYLGGMTTDKVKKRCIELMYSWTIGLKHETKIGEAYQMLKNQGIVKDDPKYESNTFQPPQPPPRRADFEDEEKSKLLSKLLKSSHPEDLQAANRLIKNMVKQDEQRLEKVTKRINELESVDNNVKLLSEMLEHYRSNSRSATEADRDLMKDLFENLDKKRPTMFRLASDTDEKDDKGIADILKANDEVVRVMNLYKQIIEGVNEGGTCQVNGAMEMNTSLLDLNSPSPMKGQSLLDNELAALGITESTMKKEGEDTLTQLLGSVYSRNTTPNVGFPVRTPQASFPVQPLMAPSPQTGFQANLPVNQPLAVPLAPSADTGGRGILDAPTNSQPSALDSLDSLGKTLIEQGFSGEKKNFPDKTKTKISMNQMVQQSEQGPPSSSSPQPQQQPGLLRQTPSAVQKGALQSTQSVAQQGTLQPTIPMPRMDILQPSQPSAEPQQPAPQAAGVPSAIPGGTASSTSTPVSRSPQKAAVLPLTDVSVPLETVKPSTKHPITAYDKNGIRIIVHFALNEPREDVRVMVVSVMSTNTSPVQGFIFQAAVPKVMKVKLQPPSATDLPAFNPIMPPSAITQVMLLANPHKEPIRLKFKISYNQDDKNISDVGEVDQFPGLYEI